MPRITVGVIRQTIQESGFPFNIRSNNNDQFFDQENDANMEWLNNTAYDYSEIIWECFFNDDSPRDWNDIENSLIHIGQNHYDYEDYMDGDFTRYSRQFLCALRDYGYTTGSPRSIRRERWESPLLPKESNTFTENPYGHLVGLEIEVTDRNVSVPLLPSEVTDKDNDVKWDCVHDGSVSCGSEFRLRTITNGDKLLKEISSFCKTMKHKGYDVDDTCGVHMHIDFSKANLPKLKNLIQFYSRYEQFIYDVVGEERKGIRFSQALRKTHRNGELYKGPQDFRFGPLADAMNENSLSKFKEAFYQTSHYEDTETYKYYDGRYSGFNVHSVFLNGTLELRYLRGTLNENYIRNWVMFNLHVVDMFIRNNNIDQNLLYFNKAPKQEEFLNWLGEGARESYKKLKNSVKYEVNK